MVEIKTLRPYPYSMAIDAESVVAGLLQSGRDTLADGVAEGRESHFLDFDSPTCCDGRRIACVTSRRWRPESTAPAGERLGRPSVDITHRVQNIGSARRPRSVGLKSVKKRLGWG